MNSLTEVHYWNAQIGKTYPLNDYMDERMCIRKDHDIVQGRYFGILRGRHIFFAENHGEVSMYSAPLDMKIKYLCDGEDSPGMPVFKTLFHGKVHDGPLKDYIMGRLHSKSRE